MGPFGLTITTGPAAEPVTAAEAKARLRITVTAEDTDIGTLITQARELAEAECGRAFINTTFTLKLDDFPRCADKSIRLPRPPLSSVTWVKYYDADGVLQTVSASDYHVATVGEPGRVLPVDGETWPAVDYGRPEAVEVKFVAGYGAAGSSVPAAAKAAILVIMAALRDDPTGSAGVPPAARRLLNTLEYGEVR